MLVYAPLLQLVTMVSLILAHEILAYCVQLPESAFVAKK
jgi:hypothetical protein